MLRLDPEQLERTSASVADGVWIGGASAPIPGAVSVVVTLEESASHIDRFGIIEIREPFPDSRWQPIDADRVSNALLAAQAYSDGSVLIRCRHGLNRSALIAALVLKGRGWSPETAIAAARQARPGALSNPYFADLVWAWPRDPMRSSSRSITQEADDGR